MTEAPGGWKNVYAGDEPDPARALDLGEATAKGIPTELAQGIVYQAPWRVEADGMSRHACANALALARAGAAIRLDSTTMGKSFLTEEIDPEAQRLLYLTHPQFKKVSLCIKHAVFASHEHLHQILTPTSTGFVPAEVVAGLMARTVLYTSWERDTLDTLSAQMLSQLAQVWVPCRDNLEAFAHGGVPRDKIRVVPYCWDPDDLAAAIPHPRGKDEVPDGKRFYTIGKWEPRKNQHLLLGAFLRAFSARDRASLFIKTSSFGKWSNYPTPQESVEHWLSHPDVIANGWTQKAFRQRVRIMDKMLSRDDLIGVHRLNNIYVSASHAEAWDIPAFEARLAGNRLVYTDWGGPREYSHPDDVPVKWDYAPVDEDYRWHGYMWPAYPSTDLMAALRKATPPERRTFDPRLTYFAQHNVGEIMVAHLSEILGSLPPGYG